jgi:hypothetical protein
MSCNFNHLLDEQFVIKILRKEVVFWDILCLPSGAMETSKFKKLFGQNKLK